ncbi:hypothetical protein ABZ318_26900 [Streptomyces sp. NPDC006197]|uniref:hypothetical protein n=1 Tax=Streptomyces sp. NPDC006197 TaxID=3156685 RepID=UPI0033BB2637
MSKEESRTEAPKTARQIHASLHESARTVDAETSAAPAMASTAPAPYRALV